MTHHSVPSNRHSLRTFVASLLAYVLLTSQLAPVAMAFNGSTNRRVLTRTPDTERKKTSEVPPQRPSAGSFAPVPVPLRVTALGGAPAITATKVDSFPDADGDGKVSPGQTITYSITITNTGDAPATNVTLSDTVDPNTTIVPGSPDSTPIAFDDSYNVVGNVRIQPNAAQGLLANDNNPETGNNTGLTASGPTTGPTNGQATVNSDGSFSYNPNPGFTGTDSFTYTVTDSTGETDIANVTLIVGNGAGGGTNVIWFVNSAAAPGGDGRLTNPFNCLVGAGCYDPVAADEAGDTIFLYNGSYTGGLTFLANQKLVGQGATATLASLAGVTPPAYSDPLPATNNNPANVTVTTTAAATNALNVSAGGILLRGFTVGNTTGAKIFGTGFGTLTTGNNTTPDLVLNGAGQALNLTNGTFAATSAFLSVATTSSGSQGINLATIAGTVGFGSTTVSGSTAQGILVGTSMANINFGNTSVSGGTDGISLQNNSAGTRTFGALSVSNNSGIGFLHAGGGGNVSVTGTTSIPAAAQAAPAGTGIDIQSLAAGTSVTFAATNVGKGNAGTAVNLGGAATGNAGNVTFNSLAITTSNGSGLVGTGNTGQINVTTNAGSISTAGGPAINITKAAAPATPITLNFGMVDSINSGTQGINIDRVSGNMTIASGTHTNSSGIGIQVQNTSAGGTMNFGNTNTSQSGGTGVFLTTNAGGVTFADLDIAPDSGQRAFHATSSTGTITSTSGDITATGNVTLEITGASAAARTPLAMTLNNLDSTNSNGTGVDLNFVSGNLTVNDPGVATNISNPTSFGIRVQNSGAGTVNFGNTNSTLSGGTGVFLNANAGGVSFADLDISPDSGQRPFHATSNTGVITSTSGTIPNSGAVAVEINGVSAASMTPLNMQFTSVSASSTSNGIILTNTSSSGSPGGFRINGDGTNTTKGGNSTGGTISNISGADGATTGIGVFLNNAANVFLRRITISGTIQNMGIHGLSVNGFTLQYSTITGTIGTTSGSNDLNLEAPIAFGRTSPSFANGFANGSVSTIDNCLINGGIQHNVEVFQQSNTFTLTISNSNITNNGAALGSDGIIIETHTDGNGGTPIANATVSVQSCLFDNNKSQALQANALGDSFLNLTVSSNTIQRTTQGNEGFVIQNASDADMTVHVTNNTFTGILGTNILVGQVVNNASSLSNLIGVIQGNTMTVGNAVTFPTNRTLVVFFSSTPGQVSTANILVDGNTINTFSDPVNGIAEPLFVSTPDANTDPSFTATVTNNVVNITDAAQTALRGIAIQSTQNVSAACLDVRGNDVNYTPLGPGVGVSGIRVRQVAPATAQLERGVSPSNVAATVLAANNPLSTTEVVGTVTVVENNTCQTAPTAPETFIAEIAEPGDIGSSGAPVAPITAPSNTESITSRPFISSPRQQAKVSAETQVVSGPRPGPLPDPTPEPPPTSEVPKPQPPVIMGDTLTWNIGTLPAGQSVTITFQVVVDNPFMGAMPQVSNQGTVTADGGISVLTDDPSEPGMNDPTVTGVTVPPDLFVRDARVAEPASGSTSMIFTLALSTPAPMSGITVNLSTADITATGGDCPSGNDYTTVTGGTVTFNAGEQIKTFPVTVCSDAIAEGDETFSLNVNSAPGANIADGQGIGTITANVPGTILISELRTSGPGGAGDDFVEIYNNTDSIHTVPAGGYGLFKRGATCDALPELLGTIPAGTNIPQRGHYLFVGSTYSLANYGGTGAAAGNNTLTGDIESDFNVGLFSTADPLSISTANRLDAVGFGVSTGGVCDLLLEGTTLQPASGSTSEHSFVREFTLVGNNVPTPTDANDNAADFTVVSTTPSMPVGSTAAPRLGAPGPENLAGPNLKKFSQVGSQLIDPMVAQSQPPNRARDTTPDPGNNSTFGTIAIRRTFTNNTGGNITRLRFRIYDITTFPSPVGTADLRARTSSNVTVTVTGVGSVTALATTLETPPVQPSSGGLNSSLTAGTVTMGTPLAPGASIHLNFLFGVQQGGSFRVFVFVEALP